jgi:hypothetical protein
MFWSPPDCHNREYFSGSPLLFDFEQDFYGRKESDLRFTTEVKDIGVAHGHRVTQVIQHVDEVRADNHMTAKRLLVQRSDGDFCAIYQQLYSNSEVTVGSASVIVFEGRPVLKTLDPNGMHGWNEEYWRFDLDGPTYLDLRAVRKQMIQAAPEGDDVLSYPFDLSGYCHRAITVKPGDCAACPLQDGTVIAKLVLQSSRLIASWVRWFPLGVQATCPGE